MIIEYKQHPLFEGITLAFLNGTLLGDVANNIWHPTSDFERLTDSEQNGIIEQIVKDGRI